MLKRILTGIAALGLAVAMTGTALAQKTVITVYTALENDQLKPYKDAFEAANPTIEIAWVRDSTGVITARFLAEKANPKADAIWGLAATSLLLFKKEGLLDSYKPAGSDALKPSFRDATAPYAWSGMDAWLAVVCYNTAEAAKTKAPRPATWADLTNPAFKGQIVMPHPASSGTGYLAVAAWLQIMGEAKGWEFMDKLHDNIAVYTHSGSAPCVQSAKGERLIGIGFDMRGASEKTKGAPIDLIIPTDGVGWDMEAFAIVKGTKHADAVRKLMDFAASQVANELYGKYYALVAHPAVKAAPPNYPSNGEAGMVRNDFGWMAENRDRILKEWVRRYEGKAQPK